MVMIKVERVKGRHDFFSFWDGGGLRKTIRVTFTSYILHENEMEKKPALYETEL